MKKVKLANWRCVYFMGKIVEKAGFDKESIISYKVDMENKKINIVTGKKRGYMKSKVSDKGVIYIRNAEIDSLFKNNKEFIVEYGDGVINMASL